MTVRIFANCIFCLKVKCLPRQQKKRLQSDIKENGGTFSFLLNPQCTHVILDNIDVLSRYQLNCMQKNHIHMVNLDFIWDSVKERRLLDVKNYDPNRSLAITPPANEKASTSEVKTDDLFLDNVPEKENAELTDFYAENMENPHFPQDFEVVKYNMLEKTRRQFTVKKTSADASEYYENYIEDLKKQGFLLREHFTPEATQLASEKLHALLLEEVLSSGSLSQEVSNLVEMIWAEALGHLEHMLLTPVNKISLNDVSKAEGILLLVKTALKNGETAEQLQNTMAEFYRLIPHKDPEAEEVNLRLLAKKEDLCQLIRDMVNVCETHLSKPNPPSLAKYRALRCKIEHVEQSTEEFSKVRKEVLQNNFSKSPVDILQIFRVGRVNEATEFLSKLGNVRPLLHGSPVRNIVGILSRGLLLPKVVEDHGVQRTDIGNLGCGIYFSDSLSTSIKYSHPGETDGSRLLVICDVALGKCMDLLKRDFSLTEAPPGYDSVHGVSKTASVPTDFEDDEFVVYKTNQVKMKYIIKFCLAGDQRKDFHPPKNTELEEYRPEISNFSKVEDYQLPDPKLPSSVKAGLQDTSGKLVPLEDVHVKGRIIDFVAQVIVFQTYTNQSHVPIEAKYVFPLDDKAAVCGFEAFINGKHIVGEIKEKEKAQQEYRDAISHGHGAYLMDQDAPDVFTVSVGNLPPQAKVLIKITYITELSVQGPVTIFFMPATVAPWQQDKALNENLQDTVEKICIKEIGTKQSFSLAMSIEMPYVIEFISSDTHKLKQKNTDCKAVISTVEGSSLDNSGFSLHIGLSDAHLPRMWVEKHPEKDTEACMLVFQPRLDAILPGLGDKTEVIICLDCSNSMEGVTFLQAKQIALYALSLVGEGQKVNVINFGTGYKELFSYPKYITSNNVPTEFIMSATPTMGNTDFWKALRYLNLLHPSQGLRNILLISDGHLQSVNLTLQLVKRNVSHTRLFSCGVSSTANRHVLRTLSQCGAGVFEYFNSKSKHSWKKQVEDQMTRLCSPNCHSVSVKWQQLSRDASEPLQAPARLPSLFRNDRLLVYGFIPHCTQATLCEQIQEKEFCTMVSTSELQKTTGTMIHKLAARAVIRDYEDGILHDNETDHEMKKKIMKSLIIKLSKENSLITQFTSFVAVEKRDGHDSPLPNVPNVSELIAKEDTDFLPYMCWQEEQPEASTTQVQVTGSGIEQDGATDNSIQLQSLSVSSGWIEELKPKRVAKKKLKLSSKLEVPEALEGASASSQSRAQPSPPGFECRNEIETLGLSQMEPAEQSGFKGQLKAARLPVVASTLALPSAGLPSFPSLAASRVLCAPPTPPLVPPLNAPFRSPAPPRQLGQAPEPGKGTDIFLQSLSIRPNSRPLSARISGRSFAGGLFGSKHSDLCKPDQKPEMSLLSDVALQLDSPPQPNFLSFPPPPPLPGGFGAFSLPPPRALSSGPGASSLPPPPSLFGGPGASSLPPPPPIASDTGVFSVPPPPPLPSGFGAFSLPPPRALSSGPGASSLPPPPSLFGGPGASSLPPPPPIASDTGVFSVPPPPPLPSGFGAFSLPLPCALSSGPGASSLPPPCALSSGPRASSLPPPPSLFGGPGVSSLPPPPPISSDTGVFSVPPPPPLPSRQGFAFYCPRSSCLVPLQGHRVLDGTSSMPTRDLPEQAAYLSRPFAATCSDSGQDLWDVSSSSEGKDDDTLAGEPCCFMEEIEATDGMDDLALCFCSPAEGDIELKESEKDSMPWKALFHLQTEDGFWKLTQELGLILNLNTNGLQNFLEGKGIQSLGTKGKERLLDLIATLLVLQFLCTKLEQKGMVFKSLMKLDDSSISRNIPWVFEEIKKASEWVRETEGQYSSICHRLDLGKDWDSATKQLLGIQPSTSPLHRILHFSQG